MGAIQSGWLSLVVNTEQAVEGADPLGCGQNVYKDKVLLKNFSLSSTDPASAKSSWPELTSARNIRSYFIRPYCALQLSSSASSHHHPSSHQLILIMSFVLLACLTVLVPFCAATPSPLHTDLFKRDGMADCNGGTYTGQFSDGQGLYVTSDTVTHPYKFPKIRKCWQDYMSVNSSVWYRSPLLFASV